MRFFLEVIGDDMRSVRLLGWKLLLWLGVDRIYADHLDGYNISPMTRLRKVQDPGTIIGVSANLQIQTPVGARHDKARVKVIGWARFVQWRYKSGTMGGRDMERHNQLMMRIVQGR